MSFLMGLIELGWRFSVVIVLVAIIIAFAVSEANIGSRR